MVVSEMLDLVSILTIKKTPTEDTQKEIINKSNPVITEQKINKTQRKCPT